MKNFLSVSFTIGILGFSVMAANAQQRMTKEQLIEYANSVQACGADRAVLDARYVSETENRITVNCGDPTGFLPAAAGLSGLGAAGAAAAGIGLAAAAAGGSGGSTPDTQ